MTSAECLRWLKGSRIVPVIRADSADKACQVARLLFEGGIDVFEVTLTVPGALDAIATLREEFGSRALVGAGTVLDSATAAECLDHGAQFVVAPDTNPEVIGLCLQRDVLCAPGALTPTEVLAAHRLGARLIKVFPCDAVGGPSYIKALKAPFPDLEMMPTGGVRLENIRAHFEAGAACVGVGSSLVDLSFMETAPGRLTELARAFMDVAKHIGR